MTKKTINNAGEAVHSETSIFVSFVHPLSGLVIWFLYPQVHSRLFRFKPCRAIDLQKLARIISEHFYKICPTYHPGAEAFEVCGVHLAVDKTNALLL